VAPVLAGSAVAARLGGIRPGTCIGALVVAVALQVGVNFANDYSDFVRGADSRRVGPIRAAASGLVPPGHVRLAAFAAFGVAAVAGLILALATNPWLIVAGLACILAGWLYTGGPRPYGYMGLGEAFVFVFFGLVAAVGTTYVETLRVPLLSVLAGVATGSLACAILVLNNIRDIDTDAAAGKRTLAVRLGRGPSRLMLGGLFAVAFAVPVVAWAWHQASIWVLLPLLLAPFAAMQVRASQQTSPPRLVAALKRTAELEAGWALLWTVGVLAA
jgi:1,4-dihydroxy-2-naphthoate octaprenyltransferase